NPAVTAMALATRRIEPKLAAGYVAAQLAGAVAAASLLRQVFAQTAWSKVQLGVTGLSPGISPVAGMAVEAILTFFLMIVIFGTAIDARGHKLGGIAIGGVVAADIMFGGPLTGASMNPARTFGPALAGGFWDNHWVYWVGPIAGSLVAAFVYEKL